MKNADNKKAAASTIEVKPFLKWAGGKSQLLPELLKRIPKNFNRYFEPFIGGGAFFFYLQPMNAYISDTNEELILTYTVIRDRLPELIIELEKIKHSTENYYSLRALDRELSFSGLSSVLKAARLIYLNKTCFNGLYRVNASGQFNVPQGKYKNPKYVDRENLFACHQVLRATEIVHDSFLSIEHKVKKGDFVYFDPPYVPLTTTSSFKTYTKEGFGEAEQVALKDLCDRLTKMEVNWMLSNSSSPVVLDLYNDYNIELVDATRSINSKANSRGKIKEALISNYAVEWASC